MTLVTFAWEKSMQTRFWRGNIKVYFQVSLQREKSTRINTNIYGDCVQHTSIHGDLLKYSEVPFFPPLFPL